MLNYIKRSLKSLYEKRLFMNKFGNFFRVGSDIEIMADDEKYCVDNQCHNGRQCGEKVRWQVAR